MSTYGSGNVLSTQTAPNLYTVTQAPGGSNLPPASHLAALGANINNHHGIDFGIGPIILSGYVDISNFGAGVELTLFGISLGSFYGNLKDGLGVSIDVIAAKGGVKIYLKDDAVGVNVQLTPIWGSGINIEQKIFDLEEEELQNGSRALKY
ncbi:MAG: hypothetical protein HETSPECPRED_005432 [Heterodermia speciosa]|uniref:Uncharacterized protein n=1 Tax=Heterodermia speciosa TaxID=116794 RepID=A0A8H3FD71_9LECA|nr:MAG: hypothetical protein HETSPECPRED_005432 [Heterodermia speciosa]